MVLTMLATKITICDINSHPFPNYYTVAFKLLVDNNFLYKQEVFDSCFLRLLNIVCLKCSFVHYAFLIDLCISDLCVSIVFVILCIVRLMEVREVYCANARL